MAPYLVLLGTQNLDERTIQDLTGNMNAILGFHPTSSEKIAATKWRYHMIVLKNVHCLIPRPFPPPPRSGIVSFPDCIFCACWKMDLVNCLFCFHSSVPVGEQSASEMDLIREP